MTLSVDQVAEAFGLEEARLKGNPRHGGGHLMFRVEARQGRFALIRRRSFQPDDAMAEKIKDRLEQQNALITYLRDQSFPVAAPLLTRDGGNLLNIEGMSYALYPYVEGRHMERGNVQQLNEVAVALSFYHRLTAEYPRVKDGFRDCFPEQFHRRVVSFTDDLATFEHPSFNLRIERSLQFFHKTLPVIEQRLRALPYDSLPKVVIHGDVRRQNLLFRGDRLAALVDFGHSLCEARALDLAIALTNLVQATDSRIFLDSSRQFVAAYDNGASISEMERKALPVLTEARIAWKAFRKVRLMMRKNKNRQRRARKFHRYVQRIRWLENNWASWLEVFSVG